MRFLSFIVVAVGVHVLIPVGARIAPRWDSLLLARSTGIAQRMLIEIEPYIEIPNLPNEQPTPDQPREIVKNKLVQPRTNVDSSGPPNPDSTGEIPPDVFPPIPTGSTTPPDEYGSLPPSGRDPGGIPGLGTGPLWSMPGMIPSAGKPPPAPTSIAAAKPTDPRLPGRLISDVMRDKDRQLGLDLPGVGTIASAVKDAVRGSNTPEFAKATFEVRIAPGGRVTSVRVLNSSAGVLGDWNAVASAVSGRLSANSFPLPESFAGGAIVTVSVVSQLQMPDGSVSGRPSLAGGGANNVGGSMTFDTANIGARPKRVIAASASARPTT